jgi:hypothetical protein
MGFDSFSLSYAKEQTVCSPGLILKNLPVERSVCGKFFQKYLDSNFRPRNKKGNHYYKTVTSIVDGNSFTTASAQFYLNYFDKDKSCRKVQLFKISKAMCK